jgi:hypothetical protein
MRTHTRFAGHLQVLHQMLDMLRDYVAHQHSSHVSFKGGNYAVVELHGLSHVVSPVITHLVTLPPTNPQLEWIIIYLIAGGLGLEK